MDKSVKMSSEVWKKIKACAKAERRDLKVVLELAVLNYMKKRILEK